MCNFCYLSLGMYIYSYGKTVSREFLLYFFLTVGGYITFYITGFEHPPITPRKLGKYIIGDLLNDRKRSVKVTLSLTGKTLQTSSVQF